MLNTKGKALKVCFHAGIFCINYYFINIGFAGKKADKQVDLHAASDCQGISNFYACKTEMNDVYFRYNRHY